MITRDTDIVSILEKLLDQGYQENLEEVGTVIKVADGICKIYGLSKAVFGELIVFESGARGIVLDLDEDYVSVVLLDPLTVVVEHDVARRTEQVFIAPVGDQLISRVINARGFPLDAYGDISFDQGHPVEHPIAGIMERGPVNRSLETGIIAIDALFPIGRGQRELIIGNRGTGKTSIAIDTILHQKGKGVICIYVSIGHRQISTAKIIHQLEQHGALAYTIVVAADSKETALNQFLAPYTGCTIGEYFMSKGKDVLIIYDDLSAHAVAYRELSLLLRRPPGREAYPGDIFYIHSRLLERSAQLSAAKGGGSLTALPIIQTQGDDISAYIATNLISITDGQVVLDTNLFNSGVRPAVNVGLSVSRVGGAAQTKAMKKVAGQLRLELAQYHDLLAFAQFGSELDKTSRKALDRGERAIEVLKQFEHKTHSFVDQVIFLFLLKEGLLDAIPLHDIKMYATECASYIQGSYADLYNGILTTQSLSDDDMAGIKAAAAEYALVFSSVHVKQA